MPTIISAPLAGVIFFTYEYSRQHLFTDFDPRVNIILSGGFAGFV